MTKEFELTQEQLDVLLEASKPTPAMWGSGGRQMFSTPHENAMRAWTELGKKMGFDPMSVRPSGNGQRFFIAEVLEPK